MDVVSAVLLGVPMTLLVTLASLAVGTVVAIPLVLGLRSRSALLRLACRMAVDIVRGVPPLVWLFVLYYGLAIGDLRFSSLTAGITGLGIVAAAYLAEIFRGALKSLQAGQWEAASALGLGAWTTWANVIAPQAWRTAIPGYTNYAIALLKDSSIVSLIGVSEIVGRAGEQARYSSAGIFVFVIAGALYIALSVPLGTLSRSVDQRLRKKVA